MELPSRGPQPPSVAMLTQLAMLSLVYCNSVALVLSCTGLPSLEALDLSHAQANVTPELVVQVGPAMGMGWECGGGEGGWCRWDWHWGGQWG